MNLAAFVSTEGLVDKACSLRRHGLPTRMCLGSMKKQAGANPTPHIL